VKAGEVLVGKYRVERVLGQGGMGVVVAARHLQLEETVALKFLHPPMLKNPDAIARFLREARAASKIKSEHVARVSDVGTLENGAPYMVMEYLDGRDLSDWIRLRGALPVEQAVEFVLQACVAVADAHALGIVHRDLKPANLFCVRRSDGQLCIKVLDFGISKVTGPEGASGPAGGAMTQTSAFMGSPYYMSPEQMTSARSVDAQSDIWALGVILYELVCGRAPFTGEMITEVVVQVTTRAPPPLCELRPDAPAALEAVILKCLEKDRARRHKHVGELAVALLPFAPPRARASVERISGILQGARLSEPVIAQSPPVDFNAVTGQTTDATLPPLGRTTTGARAGKAAMWGTAFVGAIALGGLVTFVVMSRKAGGASDASPSSQAATVARPATEAEELVKLQEPNPVSLPVAAQPAISTARPSFAPDPAPGASSVTGAAAQGQGKHPPALGARTAAPQTPVVASAAGEGAKPSPNCNPPFYFDPHGNRVFKLECE
jgi:serine/threonine-protein kinase